jgi:hypothetical protein
MWTRLSSEIGADTQTMSRVVGTHVGRLLEIKGPPLVFYSDRRLGLTLEVNAQAQHADPMNQLLTVHAFDQGDVITELIAQRLALSQQPHNQV